MSRSPPPAGLHQWAPEVSVDLDGARKLVRAAFPEIPCDTGTEMGVGWDNSAFLFDGKWVFRFPRRGVGATCLAHEVKWLPQIIPHLGLRTPIPQWVSGPRDGFPFPYAGYLYVAGTTGCGAGLTQADRAELAVPLAQALKRLHSIDIPPTVRAQAPGDWIARTDLPGRAEVNLGRIKALAQTDERQPWGALRKAFRTLAKTPRWPHPGVWVHGDLYLRHILVNRQKQLCGFIDWGDVHLGDPALDLSVGWSVIPESGRNAFRDAYGGVDEHTWQRARFRALHSGLALIWYARDVGDTDLLAAGRLAIRQAL